MADKNKDKARRLERRKHHVRNSLFGTPQRPRMSVYRSSKHIYVQLIDDYAGKTLAQVAEMRHARAARTLMSLLAEPGGENAGIVAKGMSDADVERLMAQFNLRRQREDDGSVDHVLEFFLVGPDGKQLYQYVGSRADPTTIARDVELAARNGSLANSGEPPTRAPL